MRLKAITLAGFVLSIVAFSLEAKAYNNFCNYVPSSCSYVGSNPSLFNKNVCFSSATGALTLKGTTPCPTGTTAYTLEYGANIRGTIRAYIPNACVVNTCLIIESGTGPFESSPLCCPNGETEGCTEVDGYCDGEVLFCEQAATLEDGTVGCYDDE